MRDRHDEKIRFLLVGAWNTLFSAAMLWVLEHTIPFDRDSIIQKQLILLAGWVIGVTQNLFTFKLLVFRTKGDWLGEYLRMYVTYSATFLVQSVIVQALSVIFHASLFVANLPAIAVVTVLSYLGNKHFTFRTGRARAERPVAEGTEEA